MSERRKPTSGPANVPAVIIVNNRDFPTRYAAWFGAKQAKAAKEAAVKAQFHTITVNRSDVEKIATRFSEGTLEDGKLLLAPVADNLASELDALIVARQTANAEAKESEPATVDQASDSSAAEDRALSGIWDTLRPGEFVLAADLDRQGAPEAWYEAQIVSHDGGEFMLRWRDFPREGIITRTRRHIALLHPAN
ncbi:MAG: hypothetical protein AB1508_11485 [Pseudomonadota bacterium]